MSSPSIIQRFKPHSVPLVLFAIVAIAALIVPPLVLGEATSRTYALTAAVFILAIGSVFPYALLVAVGTLPLLYTGYASYAAPQTSATLQTSPKTPYSFSPTSALRHVVAGVVYALEAAAVGAVGMGAQIAVGSGPTAVPAIFQPSFLFLGGTTVGVAFFGLQLWRYDTPLRTLDRQTILGTAVLGGLVALSPVVAFWIFNTT
ncbi:MAG: hypothetical protein ACLFNI_01220 [Natronomonas sp.]